MTQSASQSKKVLVVEDEISYAQPLVQELTYNGFTVFSAQTGLDGHRIAMAEHPDIILLDILMPAMDGMSLMQKLREDAWGKNVPIILLTNLDPDDTILKGVVKDQPAYYFIKNEVKMSDIIEKIKELTHTI